ncbi:enhancer of polycomb-like-domain-containing protein [Scheffersomyces xylosifermentans]|uniref:enhancer of polycomb-like-domain-containing protein n=1 Tax=Scheffersomyces xylosifermentans TaxID=1304137 RepID=UPI00315D69A1
MAILPAKSPGAAKQHASGARFRQRKISVKQPLTIYQQKDLPTLDINNELEPSQVHHLNAPGAQQQRDIHAIETGVDKNEEDEVHLQQVINAAQRALLGSKRSDGKSDNEKKEEETSVYIPTPDASRLWPEARKYYSDQIFKEPESYIKFSATVEDTVGVEYNLDEEDEKFMAEVLDKHYPKPVTSTKKKNSEENTKKCTELEFETICDKLEKTIEERQPFLSMDPTNILSYEELSTYIVDEFHSSVKSSNPYVQAPGGNIKYISASTLKEKLAKELQYEPFVTEFDKNPEDPSKSAIRPIPKLFELFGKPIYDHWKLRKIERRGKQIHPVLKFEDPNANEKDNDADPYICFRRREFRQARKTRRADTLGAERIRLLQKSLHRARDLIMSVAQRELLKLENWQTERAIFQSRCEGKTLKRTIGVKGDDHLFYPHKRKKIVKVREEDEEKEAKRRIDNNRKKLDSRESSVNALPGTATIGTNAVNKDKNGHHQQPLQQPEGSSSSTQPYVKLPPSKIPDLELVTVSLVLKEKNETIKRAVLEKLRKRKEQDKGFVNLTDDPYQPCFNIHTNNNTKELSHIPYSSIAAANFHQINNTNYISDTLKKLLEEGKKPLPGLKTFRGSNGELIPSKAFPHLSSLLQDHINSNRFNSSSYIAQLLDNIATNNFSAYNNGYGQQQKRAHPDEYVDESKLSDPIFRMRKRAGRSNRTFVDRRGLHTRPDDVIDEWLKLDDNDKEDKMDIDSASEKKMATITNVYDSKADAIKRMDSNWKFDNDLSEYQRGTLDPFSMDPSKLNSISDDTQSIRFGSMLLSKSYGLLRDKQQAQQAQQAQQQQAQQQQQQQQYNPQSAANPQRAQQMVQKASMSRSDSGASYTVGATPRPGVNPANNAFASRKTSSSLSLSNGSDSSSNRVQLPNGEAVKTQQQSPRSSSSIHLQRGPSGSPMYPNNSNYKGHVGSNSPNSSNLKQAGNSKPVMATKEGPRE